MPRRHKVTKLSIIYRLKKTLRLSDFVAKLYKKTLRLSAFVAKNFIKKLCVLAPSWQKLYKKLSVLAPSWQRKLTTFRRTAITTSKTAFLINKII